MHLHSALDLRAELKLVIREHTEKLRGRFDTEEQTIKNQSLIFRAPNPHGYIENRAIYIEKVRT